MIECILWLDRIVLETAAATSKASPLLLILPKGAGFRLLLVEISLDSISTDIAVSPPNAKLIAGSGDICSW